jgi:hypothetical protein
LIAVGRTGRQATVWSSLDGVRWRRLPPDPAFLFDPEPVPKGSVRVVSIDAVAGGPAGYVAIGYDAVCPRRSVVCGPRPVTVWTSRNGLSWVRRAVVAAFVGDRVAEANGLVPWGSRFVAVGSDTEWFVPPGPQQAAVWISDPA